MVLKAAKFGQMAVLKMVNQNRNTISSRFKIIAFIGPLRRFTYKIFYMKNHIQECCRQEHRFFGDGKINQIFVYETLLSAVSTGRSLRPNSRTLQLHRQNVTTGCRILMRIGCNRCKMQTSKFRLRCFFVGWTEKTRFKKVWDVYFYSFDMCFLRHVFLQPNKLSYIKWTAVIIIVWW